MVQLQAINRILASGGVELLTQNNIGAEYFTEYPAEINFVLAHAKKYGKAPDAQTMLGQFPDFQIMDVRESDEYLIGKLREEYAFYNAVPVIKKAYSMLEGNAFDALNYLKSQLPILMRDSNGGAVDLVGDSQLRETDLEVRIANPGHGFIPTGFSELDSIIGGWDTKGDLALIFARPGVGKTWTLMATLTEAWRQGYRVGLYSGEMPANEIGYRFDTLLKHYSNEDLYRGTMVKEVGEYKDYLKKLRESGNNPFYVVTQQELGGRATVSALENFAKSRHLDILGIDQYTLMRDERATKATDQRAEMEHISGDLKLMSVRNHLAIVAVNQSNRNGSAFTRDKSMPELTDVYGSDSIAQNSTKVIALRQIENSLIMQVRKNRDGNLGEPLTYLWDADHGVFTYQPSAGRDGDSEAVESEYRKYEPSDGSGGPF